MTIIVSTMCEDGKTIVFSSDRMITNSFIEVQFESEQRKIDEIGKYCVVLSSGDALPPIEVLSGIRGKYGSMEDSLVSDIAEDIKKSYQELKRKKVEDEYLSPLNMTLAEFYGEKAQNSLDSEILRDTHSKIVNYRLSVEFIVTGIDRFGAHIYVITDPGSKYCYDAINFYAGGSGSNQAESLFTYQRYHQGVSRNKALFSVFEAKKRAESAPGVGKLIDIGFINNESGIYYLGDNEKENLEVIYERKVERENQKDINDEVENLKFGNGK